MNSDIYTLGHSTHSQEEYLYMLKAFNIETLIDVRSYPGSRYMPHFNKENMEKWIVTNGIRYLHMPQLGGRRRSLKGIDENLINGWEHIAFRNYAAYTLTDEYEQGIDELIEIARVERVCYTCAESVPWKCHRSIISNTLTLKGFKVYHIMSATKIDLHEIGRYGAKGIISDGKLIYPKL